MNDTNAAQLTSHGIDTVFYPKADFEANCNVSFAEAVNTLCPANDFYMFTDAAGAAVANSSAYPHISAIFLADEPDACVRAACLVVCRIACPWACLPVGLPACGLACPWACLLVRLQADVLCAAVQSPAQQQPLPYCPCRLCRTWCRAPPHPTPPHPTPHTTPTHRTPDTTTSSCVNCPRPATP